MGMTTWWMAHVERNYEVVQPGPKAVPMRLRSRMQRGAA